MSEQFTDEALDALLTRTHNALLDVVNDTVAIQASREALPTGLEPAALRSTGGRSDH